MNNKTGLISATMHYETAILQEQYKPIHIPSFEDTPENIAYCENCPHDDCIYATLDQCRINECAIKGKYTRSERWKQSNVSRQNTSKGVLMPVAHAKHN